MQGHRREAGWVAAAARITAMLFGLATASTAGATNFVLGDSNSTPGAGGTTSWAELAFGDDHVNRAVGAASTDLYVRVCNPDCWWTRGAGPDDVWWIMLGAADPRTDPNANAETYATNMMALFELIPSDDIRLISTPNVLFNAGLNAFIDEMGAADRLLCSLLERVTCAADPREFLRFDSHYRDLIHVNDEGHRLIAAAIVPVPEPTTALLVGLALAQLARRRRVSHPIGWGGARGRADPRP
jgi:hypothetical protein